MYTNCPHALLATTDLTGSRTHRGHQSRRRTHIQPRSRAHSSWRGWFRHFHEATDLSAGIWGSSRLWLRAEWRFATFAPFASWNIGQSTTGFAYLHLDLFAIFMLRLDDGIAAATVPSRQLLGFGDVRQLICDCGFLHDRIRDQPSSSPSPSCRCRCRRRRLVVHGRVLGWKRSCGFFSRYSATSVTSSLRAFANFHDFDFEGPLASSRRSAAFTIRRFPTRRCHANRRRARYKIAFATKFRTISLGFLTNSVAGLARKFGFHAFEEVSESSTHEYYERRKWHFTQIEK